MAVDSYAIIANTLKTIVDTEFSTEQIVAAHDQLHESLGVDGAVCGISPIRELPMSGNYTAKNTMVQIQFFDFWEKEIDPTQEADPRVITGYHARLLEAIRQHNDVGTGAHWYFQWEGTEYPRDPTGNNTRFVMSLRAWSTNDALYETTS